MMNRSQRNSKSGATFRLGVFRFFIWLASACSIEPVPGQDNPLTADIVAREETFVGLLKEQGVATDTIMGFDSSGVPLLCGGNVFPIQGAKLKSMHLLSASALPPGTHSWAAIPTVIRNNGIDSFRLEVNVHGAVSNVFNLLSQSSVKAASGLSTIKLRDDGLSGDRIAGDYIFTSELLSAKTNVISLPLYIHLDTNGPTGLRFIGAGRIQIIELDGATNEFIIWPSIGVLDPAIPMVPLLQLSSNVQISPHLINVRSSREIAQEGMRTGSDIEELFQPIYRVLPDAFDFFFVFPTAHVELAGNDRTSYIAGQHWPIRVDFLGVGSGTFNMSSNYGSLGRLQGINLLDCNDRGIYSGNATHELLHQWGAFIDPALGICDLSAHYLPSSSVGSLIGGFRWTTNAQGRSVVDCNEGRNGAYHAAPLDKYLMGLISSNSLPVQLAGGPWTCESLITYTNATVTVSNLVKSHGPRVPGPTGAQRNFSLGFVAETCDRLLTPTEATFFDILAAHYTKTLPLGIPDPYVGFNWSPISRFFGEGTTWTTYYNPSTINPKIASINVHSNLVVVRASGFPSERYTLVSSTNLLNWKQQEAAVAGTNGMCTFTNLNAGATAKFYRVLWE